MATKLLLVKDVEKLGRSGDIVGVKPGYARNFLLPAGFAVVADKNAIRMQERLQEERKARAAEERKEAEAIAAKLEGIEIETIAKVDPEGHMYGSVTVLDIVSLLKDKTNLEVEKTAVILKHPIKKVGEHTIDVRFKEDVSASFKLTVLAEGQEEATA